jgi:hypothetical protein
MFSRDLNIRISHLQEQPNDIFASEFFHEWVPPNALTRFWKLFKFGLECEEIFGIINWLSAVVYSGESMLAALFCTESCNSPIRL